jgi:hypothetical protein
MPQSFRFGESPTVDRDIQSSRVQSFTKATQPVERIVERLQGARFRTTTAAPDTDAWQGIIDCAAE